MSTKNTIINHILIDKHFDLRKQIHPDAKNFYSRMFRSMIMRICKFVSKVLKEKTQIFYALSLVFFEL